MKTAVNEDSMMDDSMDLPSNKRRKDTSSLLDQENLLVSNNDESVENEDTQELTENAVK